MNYRELIKELTPLHGQGEAQAIVRMVMEECFGLSLSDLLLGKDSEIYSNNSKDFENIAEQLMKGVPVQQVLGYSIFRGRKFDITPDVLIPRPETEELVSLMIEVINKKKGDRCIRVLDVGTGSGCIAISLALELNNIVISAIDIDEKALRVAQKNAEKLNATVNFLQRDILNWEKDYRDEMQGYDVIVSNPPYICQHERKQMQAVVLEHEPHVALFVPDEDPLCFYKAISEFAKQRCKPCIVGFEINCDFDNEMKDLLQNLGYKNILLHQDQYEKNRFIIAEI